MAGKHVAAVPRRRASAARPRARRAGWSPACTGQKPFLLAAMIGSQSQYDRGSPAVFDAARAFSLTALKLESRREHQALLRPGDGHVDAPLVVAVVDRARATRSCRRAAAPGGRRRRWPARTSGTRLVTPVDVSLCTTHTALISCVGVRSELARRPRRGRRRAASRRARSRRSRPSALAIACHRRGEVPGLEGQHAVAGADSVLTSAASQAPVPELG